MPRAPVEGWGAPGRGQQAGQWCCLPASSSQGPSSLRMCPMVPSSSPAIPERPEQLLAPHRSLGAAGWVQGRRHAGCCAETLPIRHCLCGQRHFRAAAPVRQGALRPPASIGVFLLHKPAGQQEPARDAENPIAPQHPGVAAARFSGPWSPTPSWCGPCPGAPASAQSQRQCWCHGRCCGRGDSGRGWRGRGCPGSCSTPCLGIPGDRCAQASGSRCRLCQPPAAPLGKPPQCGQRVLGLVGARAPQPPPQPPASATTGYYLNFYAQLENCIV